MINDRDVRMSGDELMNYLEMLKAEDILKIEVIPVARGGIRSQQCRRSDPYYAEKAGARRGERIVGCELYSREICRMVAFGKCKL